MGQHRQLPTHHCHQQRIAAAAASLLLHHLPRTTVAADSQPCCCRRASMAWCSKGQLRCTSRCAGRAAGRVAATAGSRGGPRLPIELLLRGCAAKAAARQRLLQQPGRGRLSAGRAAAAATPRRVVAAAHAAALGADLAAPGWRAQRVRVWREWAVKPNHTRRRGHVPHAAARR